MIIFHEIREIKKYISELNNTGVKIGFVPTMGALHKGHISLVKRAKDENAVCVCSIFVNPAQFNNKEDLELYPRTLEADTSLLESVGCDVLFAPSEQEMYPEPDNTTFDFGGLDKPLEGKFRPGHFNGVAIIVKKLFDIVNPTKAYFGEKDFQQLVIIKYMVKNLGLPVEIVSCETEREHDGFAISSRNSRLSESERKEATEIYRMLWKIKQISLRNDPPILRNWLNREMIYHPLMKLDYFEIVNTETLEPVSDFNNIGKCIACIAVQLGNVRLIDNIKFL